MKNTIIIILCFFILGISTYAKSECVITMKNGRQYIGEYYVIENDKVILDGTKIINKNEIAGFSGDNKTNVKNNDKRYKLKQDNKINNVDNDDCKLIKKIATDIMAWRQRDIPVAQVMNAIRTINKDMMREMCEQICTDAYEYPVFDINEDANETIMKFGDKYYLKCINDTKE